MSFDSAVVVALQQHELVGNPVFKRRCCAAACLQALRPDCRLARAQQRHSISKALMTRHRRAALVPAAAAAARALHLLPTLPPPASPPSLSPRRCFSHGSRRLGHHLIVLAGCRASDVVAQAVHACAAAALPPPLP